jgi:uncharacterized damage-inducible protein DinB
MSHRNVVRVVLASAALAAALSFSGRAFAQDSVKPAAPAGIKGEMLREIQEAEDKLGQLAEAIPESKYGWSPDKGVRTVGEVFMHVTAANYGIPSFIGVKPPAGFNFATYEHSLTKKADIMKAMKASFAHMEGALTATSDADMDKPAEFFGMKTTVRGGYLLLLSHAHEHLGQAIAYARSNKVTPPWTAKEQAEEAKTKAPKK